MTTYLVATIKPWNTDAFHRHSESLPGTWHLIERPEQLTPALIDDLNPRFVFFPHWSWVVGPEILQRAECVCFHAADVPYGRGGSPVQNLIVRGHRETQLSALRMVRELDAGPVYAKQSLTLCGSGQEIFERIADQVWSLIAEIVSTEPEPIEQTGEPVVFTRRTPEQSRLPEGGSLERLFDHIRMLDAETYPRAFLEHGEYRLEFSEAVLEGESVTARVRISRSAATPTTGKPK
jgi:methionyl-tRNA formyltransferase